MIKGVKFGSRWSISTDIGQVEQVNVDNHQKETIISWNEREFSIPEAAYAGYVYKTHYLFSNRKQNLKVMSKKNTY